jgi:hypothetical protein
MVILVTIVSGSSTWILRSLVFRDVMLPRGVGVPDVSKECNIFIFKDKLVHFVYRKFIGIIVITSNINKFKYFVITN